MPSPRYRREVLPRLRLRATRCRACGKVDYPERAVCSSCRGRDGEELFLSRKGKVVTSTVIHVPPTEFLMESPYAMAIVETPEKARLMVQVVDCDPGAVGSGMDVELEFRRIRAEARSGILCYGFKAVPAG